MKKTSICSPERSEHYLLHGTCFTLQELYTLARLYNKHNPTSQISLSSQKNITIEYLLQHLEKKLARKCTQKGKRKNKASNELCWVQQPFVAAHTRQSLLNEAFRPLKPLEWYKNEYQWLNTLNIMHVMHQYERYHSHFKFLGVFPIDFASKSGDRCVSQEMCAFDVKALQAEGKHEFAAVFNLDRHDQPGSHWVACFGNILPNHPKFGVAYFDSGGHKPPKQVAEFMKTVKAQINELMGSDVARPFHTKYNPTRKQFKNTECGIFCLLYIILHLQHKHCTYRKVRNMIGRDEDVHKMRDALYAPNDPVNQ